MKGQRFQTIEEIKEKTREQLNSIPEEEFSRCMEQWKHRWEKCIHSRGEYFEGDKYE
jgi:hypothetical protein